MEKSTNKKKRSQTDNDVQNYKQHGSDKNSENHFTNPTRKSRHVHIHSYAIPPATKDFRKW
jgi:hypothetical protein